jgi:hypothetical protein
MILTGLFFAQPLPVPMPKTVALGTIDGNICLLDLSQSI